MEWSMPDSHMKSLKAHIGKKEKESKKQSKVHKVMKEWKAGKLHSGSKKGKKVTSHRQAIAIALSEAGKKKK